MVLFGNGISSALQNITCLRWVTGFDRWVKASSVTVTAKCKRGGCVWAPQCSRQFWHQFSCAARSRGGVCVFLFKGQVCSSLVAQESLADVTGQVSDAALRALRASSHRVRGAALHPVSGQKGDLEISYSQNSTVSDGSLDASCFLNGILPPGPWKLSQKCCRLYVITWFTVFGSSHHCIPHQRETLKSSCHWKLSWQHLIWDFSWNVSFPIQSDGKKNVYRSIVGTPIHPFSLHTHFVWTFTLFSSCYFILFYFWSPNKGKMDVRSQSWFSAVTMRWFPKPALVQAQKWDQNLSISDLFLWIPCLKIKHRGLGGSILIKLHYLCQPGNHLSFHKSESATWNWMTHLSFAVSSFALVFLRFEMLKMKRNHKLGQMRNVRAWLWFLKMFHVSFCSIF